MMMKKLFLLTLVSALPQTMLAQDDDMYFVPSKETKAKDLYEYGLPRGTYYSGSSRSVDDYNRRTLTGAIATDSLGNDIIDFSAVRGVYPDSIDTLRVAEDYKLTRRMSRFDDYTPSEAYWEGYRDGRWMSPWYSYNSWYWNDPWYWRSSWYWNDPWYYGYYGYYGYYSPWYIGSYYRPWYYTGYYRPYYFVGGGGGGRISSGRPANHRPALNGNNFGGNRGRSTRTYTPPSRNNNPSFGGNRSTGMGGGSFNTGGGGGGSSMGGGRSASGGRSFGGRR